MTLKGAEEAELCEDKGVLVLGRDDHVCTRLSVAPEPNVKLELPTSVEEGSCKEWKSVDSLVGVEGGVGAADDGGVEVKTSNCLDR